MATIFDRLLLQSPNPTEDEINGVIHHYKTKSIVKTRFEAIAELKMNWVMEILKARQKFCYDNHDKIQNLGGYIDIDLPLGG
jgi:hypothetical protein